MTSSLNFHQFLHVTHKTHTNSLNYSTQYESQLASVVHARWCMSRLNCLHGHHDFSNLQQIYWNAENCYLNNRFNVTNIKGTLKTKQCPNAFKGFIEYIGHPKIKHEKRNPYSLFVHDKKCSLCHWPMCEYILYFSHFQN